ncbi:MAG: tRNA(Ile)-lysidine synthetase, partial [Defluviitaleaceae bacterium]|nr:tRNA(Ile)-lysidine synthetase [Defluviitaleaceae bacterium]
MLRPARENRLILGLSGGMDSMCLLHVLMKLNESGIFAVSLTAVHVNHCLRGADADADEAFVREYCENAGVSVKTFRVNVREIARRDKL